MSAIVQAAERAVRELVEHGGLTVEEALDTQVRFGSQTLTLGEIVLLRALVLRPEEGGGEHDD